MWKAIENSLSLVKQNGYFFIAIYNNQGWKSKFWWFVKYFYNILPNGFNKIFAIVLGSFFQIINILKYTYVHDKNLMARAKSLLLLVYKAPHYEFESCFENTF